MLEGHLAMKRRGPQRSGCRIKIYFYLGKKSILMPISNTPPLHPRKIKNQSKKNFESACKMFNTSANDELLASAKLASAMAGTSFFIFL